MDSGDAINDESLESFVFILDIAKDTCTICPKDRFLNWYSVSLRIILSSLVDTTAAMSSSRENGEGLQGCQSGFGLYKCAMDLIIHVGRSQVGDCAITLLGCIREMVKLGCDDFAKTFWLEAAIDA